MATLIDKTLEVALAQKGVREVGENRGQKVEAYLQSVGLGPGNPWCAAFVYWCIEEAAGALSCDNPFLRTGSCRALSGWAEEHALLEPRPEVGDVFLHWSTVDQVYRASHTGLVTCVTGSEFSTVEGNTNLDGSREGIGVFARNHTNDSRYRFIRWMRLLDDGDKKYQLFVNDALLCEMPVLSGRAFCPVRKWGEAMGFQVEWNNDLQVPLFDGHECATQVVVLGEMAYAPIRDLAASAGLTLTVDAPNRRVCATRPA